MILVAAILSVLVTTAGALAAVRAGLRLLRTLRAFRDALGESLAALARRSERIEHELNAAAAGGEGVQAGLERLRRSRARLAFITGALDETRASAGRVTAAYPRK